MKRCIYVCTYIHTGIHAYICAYKNMLPHDWVLLKDAFVEKHTTLTNIHNEHLHTQMHKCAYEKAHCSLTNIHNEYMRVWESSLPRH